MLAIGVIAGLATLLIGAGQAIEARPTDTILPEDLIFVTDDNNSGKAGFSGCDEIRVVDARTGAGVDQSHYRMSPGRLTLTSDARLVLATRINGEGEWVRVMVRYPGERPKWASRDVSIGAGAGLPIAISPDDETMLVGLVRHEVEKHRVADISLTSLGPAMGSFPMQAAEIVFSPDSRDAYLIDVEGAVHVVDVGRMQPIGAPIPYTPGRIAKNVRLSNTFASISPDGRYLVINTRGPDVNIVDLVQRRSVLVPTAGVDTTYDLEFNYAAPDENLLAVHGRRAVAVYRLHGMGSLESLARLAVPGQTGSGLEVGPVEEKRLDTLAWTGSGDGVIAAISGMREYRILDWELGPPASLRPRLDFDACTISSELPYGQQTQYDVVTVNKPSVPVTPTPTASPRPTMTPEPVIITSTATPTLAPTNTPTGTPSATPTPSVTPRPGPVYLPLSLREQCIPGQQRVDVALVIDASSSMEDPTSTGRRKLNAALEAVTQFLANLALPSDQAAIVVFNSDAWLRQGLTGDRGLITSALEGIQTAKQTRLDRGVAVAHQELSSSRRRPGNQAVMILLTDGLANPVPASVAVEEAAAAKADQTTIFTIGLGNELDEWALQAMASRPDYYYWAPDAEELAGIYRRIAVTIPCPAVQFWGRR